MVEVNKKMNGFSNIMIKIFLMINNLNTKSKISKNSNISITSVNNNINFLIKKGYVKYLKVGREKRLSYTQLGSKLYIPLIEVINIINGAE